MKLVYLPLGALFGFLLSRGGATTVDYYASLFMLQDLRLLWLIVAAVAVAAPGILLMKRFGVRTVRGEPIVFSPKPLRPGLLFGALAVGLGWGLVAACPGTVLAMVGEGKLAGLFIIAGIVLGTWAFGVRQDRLARVRARRAEPGSGSSPGSSG